MGAVQTAYVDPNGTPVSVMDLCYSVVIGTAATGAKATYTPAGILADAAGTPLARLLATTTGVYARWRVIKASLTPNLLNICPSMAYAILPAGGGAAPNALSDVLNARNSTLFMNTTSTSGLFAGPPWSPKKDFTVSLDIAGTDAVWLDNNTAATAPNLFSVVRFSPTSVTDSFLLMIRVELKGFNPL